MRSHSDTSIIKEEKFTKLLRLNIHTQIHKQGKHGMDLDIMVLEGSRLKSPGVFKNSYHVVATNVAVASNTGPLRALVRFRHYSGEFKATNDCMRPN